MKMEHRNPLFDSRMPHAVRLAAAAMIGIRQSPPIAKMQRRARDGQKALLAGSQTMCYL
jgi:hypothetical protein